MTLNQFTKALESEFEELSPGTLTPATNYREIKSWSSMHALIIIAFVDTTFDVTLNAKDLKSANTVSDLYNIVQEKIKK